jgi:hypothetical protein
MFVPGRNLIIRIDNENKSVVYVGKSDHAEIQPEVINTFTEYMGRIKDINEISVDVEFINLCESKGILTEKLSSLMKNGDYSIYMKN